MLAARTGGENEIAGIDNINVQFPEPAGSRARIVGIRISGASAATSLTGPGRLESVSLNPYRVGCRLQERAFDMVAAPTAKYVSQPRCTVPQHGSFSADTVSGEARMHGECQQLVNG